ncbi:MAG: FABP family protein [Nocardioides sp.]
MPFEIPDNVHPDCAPIAWLLGTWHGNGHGDYPTTGAFQFGQECIFTHDGRPFLHYMSRAWIVDDEGAKVREAAIETGFIRPRADGSLEWLLAHHTGFVEIWIGNAEIGTPRLEISTDAVVRTETAKEMTGGHRMYGMVEGDLLWAYDMAAGGHPLQPHLWGRLVRQ